MHLSREERQRIVEEFTIRHNGVFNAETFVMEVKRVGSSHPAYAYFEWDEKKAALNYLVGQAREFVRDLRISFKVEEVGRKGTVTVKMVEGPFLISPVSGRSSGGGYVLTDVDNPEHMIELCQQARSALSAWLRRYAVTIEHVKGSRKSIEDMIRLLDVEVDELVG